MEAGNGHKGQDCAPKILAEIVHSYKAVVDGPCSFFVEDFVEMYPDAKVRIHTLKYHYVLNSFIMRDVSPGRSGIKRKPRRMAAIRQPVDRKDIRETVHVLVG